MVRTSLIVLFCAMLFVGGCYNSGSKSTQKECAYNVKGGCCSGALAEKCAKATTCSKELAEKCAKASTCSKKLAEKCAKASTCSKTAAGTSSKPATCSSQTAK